MFDMDGLLIDSELVYRTASRLAARDVGYDISDDLYLELVGRTHADCGRILIEALGPEFPLDEFEVRWPGHWDAHVTREGMPRKPGLDSLLELLENRSVPFAIATSSGQARARQSLESAGLHGRFNILVTGDQVTRGKPNPEIYLEAASRLGVDPSLCVAFEDSDPGVFAAAAAGMTTIMVPDLKAPSERARAVVHRVVESLHDALDEVAHLFALR